jgi:hypothetical protein
MITAARLTEATGILDEGASSPAIPAANVNNLQVLAEEVWVASWLPGLLISEIAEVILGHLGPFQEILDELTGDPAAITSHAESVRSVGRSVAQSAPDATAAGAAALRQWKGEAAAAFTPVSQAVPPLYRAYDSAACVIAESEVQAAERVAGVREYVIDTVGDMIAELVRVGLQVAGNIKDVGLWAAAGFLIAGPGGAIIGAGAAIAKLVGEFAAWAYGFVNMYLANVVQVLQELVRAVTGVIGRIQGVGSCMSRAAIVLKGGTDPGRPGDLGDGSARDRFGTYPQADDYDLAQLAQESYDHEPFGTDLDLSDGMDVPDGYTELSAAELRALGIDPNLLEDPANGFQARVYRSDDGEIVVAMRGTEPDKDRWPDISEDAIGAVTVSPQTQSALRLAEAIDRSSVADDTTYTGHSLGGRLASAAALYSGSPAVTFQAAGVSPATVDYIAAQNGQTSQQLLNQASNGQIRAYHTADDPLTNAQQHLDQYGFGNVSAAAPDAVGHPISLGGDNGSFGGHGMDNMWSEMKEGYPYTFRDK